MNDAIFTLHNHTYHSVGLASAKPAAVACLNLMNGRQNKLQEDARFRVLRLLEGNPNLSQRELASAAGISVGSAHYVLNALVKRGLVKFGNFAAAKDKRRYAYVLTAKGLAEKAAIAGRFLSRKLEEYEALKREIEELEAEFNLAVDVPQAPNTGSGNEGD